MTKRKSKPVVIETVAPPEPPAPTGPTDWELQQIWSDPLHRTYKPGTGELTLATLQMLVNHYANLVSNCKNVQCDPPGRIAFGSVFEQAGFAVTTWFRVTMEFMYVNFDNQDAAVSRTLTTKWMPNADLHAKFLELTKMVKDLWCSENIQSRIAREKSHR